MSEQPLKPTEADGSPTAHFGYNARYLINLNAFFSNVAAQTAAPLAAIGTPAEIVLLTDAKASKIGSWCGDDGKFLLPPSAPDAHCWGRPNFLHTKNANIFWLDGHATARSSGRFYAGQEPLDRFFDLE